MFDVRRSQEDNRLIHRHPQHPVDRLPFPPDREDVRLKTAAFAFGAAHEDIAEKLHLDLLKAHAAAALAAARAGVEGERARRESLCDGFGRFGEKFADAVVDAEVKRGRGARRARASGD